MWSKKRVGFALLAIIISWNLLQKHSYTHNLEMELPNIKPFTIWSLMSNFQTIVALNPTIISYTILSNNTIEGGKSVEKKSFKVFYEEHLVHLPFVRHKAIATYEVYEKTKSRPFRIYSEHVTEVLGNSLKTTEDVSFWEIEQKTWPGESEKLSTQMTSVVVYECHFLLSIYCEMEFKSQRTLIHQNIQNLVQNILEPNEGN